MLCGCAGGRPERPGPQADGPAAIAGLTHGPMLGRLRDDSVAVWARTETPGSFQVFYGTAPDRLDRTAGPARTSLEDDNTGWLEIDGLAPRTKYFYAVSADGRMPESAERRGHFHTLPAAGSLADPEHNPRGLFNFRFAIGSGNDQDTGYGSDSPVYRTMLDELVGEEEMSRVDFAILNGGWLPETARGFPAEQWRAELGLSRDEAPRTIRLMPWVAGVWEVYKVYLERAANLRAWHRRVPSYFIFDDHEILSGVDGTGEVGRRNSKAVFRDLALTAFYDYLGWANEIPPTQPILFGEAELEAGSDVLTDREASFSKLELGQSLTLHVHWGSDHGALVEDAPDASGDPNANVYEIVEVLDDKRLRIRPAAAATGNQTYSVGRVSYWMKRVANVDFFFLDTRSTRQMRDVKDPFNPEKSIIGSRQKEWLKREMAASDADISFVASSTSFTIPDSGGGGKGLDELSNDDGAWTAFRAERDELIDFWDGLGRPVLLLTGGLRNSFAVKITKRVWEFALGSHNLPQRSLADEGGRPPNGRYERQGAESEIRWSTFALPDTPRPLRNKMTYAVAQVNNVYSNPAEEGKQRWAAYPRPQVVIQYYDGLTGELLYAESVLARE
jgi:phosphodiesterase/alkaline phosphatase D-like protein